MQTGACNTSLLCSQPFFVGNSNAHVTDREQNSACFKHQSYIRFRYVHRNLYDVPYYKHERLFERRAAGSLIINKSVHSRLLAYLIAVIFFAMIGENTVTKYSHSSLPLQMLVYFSNHYTPFFFFINLCLFTYKGKEPTTVATIWFSLYHSCTCVCYSRSILLPRTLAGLGTYNNIFVFVHRWSSVAPW